MTYALFVAKLDVVDRMLTKECSSQISSSAEICPHCAYPIKKKQLEKQNMYKIFALLALLLAIVFLMKMGWFEPLIQKLFGSLF